MRWRQATRRDAGATWRRRPRECSSILCLQRVNLLFRIELKATNIAPYDNIKPVLQNLQVRGRVHVPVILSHFTSKRVLTMELIENAADVCDVAALQHMGVRPDAVAKLVQPYTAVGIRGHDVWTIAYLLCGGQVSQTFADMIYTHGFVHCDPHEANLLVGARVNK